MRPRSSGNWRWFPLPMCLLLVSPSAVVCVWTREEAQRQAAAPHPTPHTGMEVPALGPSRMRMWLPEQPSVSAGSQSLGTIDVTCPVLSSCPVQQPGLPRPRPAGPLVLPRSSLGVTDVTSKASGLPSQASVATCTSWSCDDQLRRRAGPRGCRQTGCWLSGPVTLGPAAARQQAPPGATPSLVCVP